MFRINYGNGQVSGNFGSYSAAREAIVAQEGYSQRIGQSSAGAWIQEYIGDGEWGSAHMSADRKRPHVGAA